MLTVHGWCTRSFCMGIPEKFSNFFIRERQLRCPAVKGTENGKEEPITL